MTPRLQKTENAEGETYTVNGGVRCRGGGSARRADQGPPQPRCRCGRRAVWAAAGPEELARVDKEVRHQRPEDLDGGATVSYRAGAARGAEDVQSWRGIKKPGI